jgi:phosphomethylpyrimidine synthase
MAKPQAENSFFGPGIFFAPGPWGGFMLTQIELARQGITTEQMQTVAQDEKMDPGVIRKRVADGQIVIPNNPFRKHQKVVGIGNGLRTKVNASIGTSSDICDIDMDVFRNDIGENKQSSRLPG